MPKSCNAPRCTNSNKKGYCLTTFPQDSKIKEAWIDAAGVTDWKPTKTAALCEVHFHPSALYCVGNKKFIKKNVIPTMFCKCDEHIKRKFLAEIKSKESIESLASKKVRNDHSYFIESKSCKTNQYVNEFREHNYFSVRKSTECRFQSQKEKLTGKYVHTSNCIVMKKPITIDTLKKALSEKDNDKLDSNPVEDNNNRNTVEDNNNINTLPEIAANETVFIESSPSPEEFNLLQEKLKMANKEKDALKSQVKYLEKKVLLMYEEMQVKLNIIKGENKVLKERVHRLQDDLIHIKSFVSI